MNTFTGPGRSVAGLLQGLLLHASLDNVNNVPNEVKNLNRTLKTVGTAALFLCQVCACDPCISCGRSRRRLQAKRRVDCSTFLLETFRPRLRQRLNTTCCCNFCGWKCDGSHIQLSQYLKNCLC